MERNVYPHAFKWLAEIRAADEYGTRAALAFAAAARVETRKNCLEASMPSRNEPPSVVAGDSMFEDWFFKKSFAALLNEYIKECVEFELPECLEELVPVLESAIKKAKATRKKMGG